MGRTYQVLVAVLVSALVSLALHGATTTVALAADDYPSKSVRIIGPQAPGGGNDIMLRVLAQKLQENGWPAVIVDARPGGGGAVGSIATKRADPDGYTLLQVNVGSHAILPAMNPAIGYDPVADFTSISNMWSFPSILSVPASSPVKSIDDLIALAKRPGGINYASQQTGAPGHLLGLMFVNATKINATHVPYQGAGPALVDLIAGRADMMFASYGSIGQYVQAGQLRMIAITSKQRLSILPDLPTIGELGYPSVFLDAWNGIVGPPGMPAPLVATIRDKVQAVLKTKEMHDKLNDQGWQVTLSTPDEFRDIMHTDTTRLRALLKDAQP